MNINGGGHRGRGALTVALSAGMLLVLSGQPAAAAKGGHAAFTSPPTVSIASPAPGATLHGSVTVSGTASSPKGIAGVALAVDGGAFQPAAGTTSWSYPIDTVSYADGSHTITVQVTSSSGSTALQSLTVAFDNTSPSVAVTAPASGATVTGTVTVTGTASDNIALASVQVQVDGGAPATATGTSSWTWSLDTTAYVSGSHTLTATAVDGAGNSSRASVTATFGAATSPVKVSIAAPSAGATVSGTVAVSGSASGGSGVSAVQVSVDSGTFQTATGTSSWSVGVDTTTLTNGSHAFTARATDSSGATVSASVSVTVSNSTSSSLGNCPDGSAILQQLISPEGMSVDICTTEGGWTANSIYQLIKANALDLTTLGPTVNVFVTTGNPSAETSSAACCDASGHYYNYKAWIFLNPSSTQNFSVIPDAIASHEYGHAWTWYWFFMNPANNGSWAAYNNFRWANSTGTQVLAQNSSLNTTYNWMDYEMAADDYRVLFGTPAAVSGLGYMNSSVPYPTQVTGLATWLLNTWR